MVLTLISFHSQRHRLVIVTLCEELWRYTVIKLHSVCCLAVCISTHIYSQQIYSARIRLALVYAYRTR